MNKSILKFKDLQVLTGYKKASKVMSILDEKNIKYIIGRSGLTSTIEAVNAGLGVNKTTQQNTYEIK